MDCFLNNNGIVCDLSTWQGTPLKRGNQFLDLILFTISLVIILNIMLQKLIGACILGISVLRVSLLPSGSLASLKALLII